MHWPFVLRSKFEEAQHEARVSELSLQDFAHAESVLKRNVETLQAELTLERTRRVAAESIAVERTTQIDRLTEQEREVRAELSRLISERIRSVDAVNVKLMADRAPEAAPDMTQFKALNKAKEQIVQQVREVHRRVDRAVLEKLHPRFRRPLSESAPENSDIEAV